MAFITEEKLPKSRKKQVGFHFPSEKPVTYSLTDGRQARVTALKSDGNPRAVQAEITVFNTFGDIEVVSGEPHKLKDGENFPLHLGNGNCVKVIGRIA